MDSLQVERRYLPASRAATYMGVSVQTIRRLAKSGRLHRYRPNGAAVSLYDVVELDNYIRRG